MGSCNSTVPKLKKKKKKTNKRGFTVFTSLSPHKKNNHHRTCLAFQHLPCPLPGRPLPPFCHLASPCPAFRTQINSAASGEPPPLPAPVNGVRAHSPSPAFSTGTGSPFRPRHGAWHPRALHHAHSRGACHRPPDPAESAPPSLAKAAAPRSSQTAGTRTRVRGAFLQKGLDPEAAEQNALRTPRLGVGLPLPGAAPGPPSRPQPSPSKAFRARLEPVSGDRQAEMARTAGPARPLGALGKQRLQRGSPGPLTF